MQSRYISPIRTRKQSSSTHSQNFFSQHSLMTRGWLSLESTPCNSVPGFFESNSVEELSLNKRRDTPCLGSLFCNYDMSALRNCQVVSVVLPDAPQAIYLADDMYHIISPTTTMHIKNDSQTHGISISSIQCQACVMRPCCCNVLSFNQGDLLLHPDMDFFDTQSEPILAARELEPSL